MNQEELYNRLVNVSPELGSTLVLLETGFRPHSVISAANSIREIIGTIHSRVNKLSSESDTITAIGHHATIAGGYCAIIENIGDVLCTMSPVSTIVKKILEMDKDINDLGTKDLLKLTMMSQIHAKMIMTTGDGESIDGLGYAIKRCLKETPTFVKDIVQEKGLSLAETLADEYISDDNSLFKSILSPKVIDHLKLLRQDIEVSSNPQAGSLLYSPSSHISSLLLLVHILYEIGPIDSALDTALDMQEKLLKAADSSIAPSPDTIKAAIETISLLDMMLKCICDLHRVITRSHVTGDVLVKAVMDSEYWKGIIETGHSIGRFSDTGYSNLLNALAALGVNNMPQDVMDHPDKTDLYINKISKILNISSERVRKALAAECSCSKCTASRETNNAKSV